MSKVVLLLRGINVGGVKVPMAELKTCLEEAGFRDVQTVLNTGNVVCTPPPGDPVELSEAALSASFGYSAKVLSLSPDELERCASEFPWVDVPETSHRYVVFGDADELLDELVEVGQPSPTERLVRGTKCVYWVVPKGDTLGTDLSKLFAKARYKKSTTTRNYNTVQKLIELCKA